MAGTKQTPYLLFTGIPDIKYKVDLYRSTNFLRTGSGLRGLLSGLIFNRRDH